jgi:transcriptional repressor NrdR
MSIKDYIIIIKKYGGRIGMKCPFCSHQEDRVIDSRPTDEGATIRRRRECLKCRKRYTTYEKVESLPIMVIKKDGSRQAYDREKVRKGILRACEKRSISMNQIENIIDIIEANINNSLEREVTSSFIGELVMEKLKDLDEVAYVRFASVYRQFKDINTFMNELNKLLNK